MYSPLTNIFISIITPVYNRQDCIGRCIDSVIGQSFSNYEFIIVNDGSNDLTQSIINSYTTAYTKLQFINYDDNRGVNYARNRGIENARGKFILFLDSDDYLRDDALEIIHKITAANDGFEHYLFGVSDRVGDPLLPVEPKVYKFADWLSGKINGDFAHVIKPSCFLGLPFIENFRLYESLNWLRVLKRNTRQLFIPEVILVRERNRHDSLTNEAVLNNRQSILNNYNYLNQYISWYGADFIEQGQQDILISHFKKAFMLGLALGLQSNNQTLLLEMENKGIRFDRYKMINKRILRLVFYKLLVAKSKYNQFKKTNK